jgi:hypothetical protein
MTGLLVFVVPDGRSAEIGEPSARLICDRLWDQGIAAGAATAATRISDALHTHRAFRGDVAFSERELPPLIEAAQVHPPTWTFLLEGADLPALPEAERERLLEVCEELIETLSVDHDHNKVRTLIVAIERLRENLLAAG